jgi:hypothetical protein
MAQNNYIDLLRNANLARDLSKQQSVLNPSLYTELKSYSLTKTIPNTKLVFNDLIPQKQSRIFDMDLSLNNCANIQECKNTDKRPNRQLHDIQLPYPTFRLNKVYTPKCCTFINGQVTRNCICSKKVCKYGTDYCGSTKKGGISGQHTTGP